MSNFPTLIEIDENGDKHCENGPAVTWSGGTKEWWLNGKRHREDGPAVESAHHQAWYLNGLLHREDGPAMERPSDGYKAWFLNGKCISLNEPPENWEELVLLARIEQVMDA